MKAILSLALISLFVSSAFGAASTASPTSASFNITPVLVFTSTNSSGTANDAKITTSTVSSAATVYNPLITFGPGATNTTIYAYSPLFVAATGSGATGGSFTGVVVRTINANQVVAAPTDSTESSVQTADVSNTITAVTFRGLPQAVAVGLGTFAIAGTIAGTNAAGNVDTLTMYTTSGTAISQTITVATATTAGTSGPLLTFAANAIWYEDGIFYILYESQSVTGSFSSGAFSATAGSTATTVTALSLHAFGATNGTKLWTAGATSLAGTLAITSSSVALTPITMAMGANNNRSMSSLALIAYKTVSASPPTTSMITVTRSTGAVATSATVIGTDVTTSPATTYVPGGFVGSNYTYGVLLANSSGSTVAYGIMGFLNGTTTAASATQLAIPLGSQGQISAMGTGYGTGFGLIYKTPQSTGATYTLQAYFANGTVNGTSAALGTFEGLVSEFVDASGALWVGYYTWDKAGSPASNGALMGYVGRAVAQTNYYNATTKAANVLATFAAILSFVIASLFMF